MTKSYTIMEEIPGLYQLIPMKVLRRTEGVAFDAIPVDAFSNIGSYDRVLHKPGALSPGSVGEVKRPWYMHPHQADNLVVLYGSRFVEIYTPQHGKVENFTVTPHQIKKNGTILYDGPAMLVWPVGVFHRIISDEETGSASLNIAVHYPGFDIQTNFNIYDLDIESGNYFVIREGRLDQPNS